MALYAIAVVMSTLMVLPEGHFLADSTGHLSISWAVVILGAITLVYTIAGGFLAVLMTDVIQFGVLIAVVLFMIPLSLHTIGGLDNFINSPALPDTYFDLASGEYPWIWLLLWTGLNIFQMGGDWPFVQRYISVPTARDARRSNYPRRSALSIHPYTVVPSGHGIPHNQSRRQSRAGLHTHEPDGTHERYARSNARGYDFGDTQLCVRHT